MFKNVYEYMFYKSYRWSRRLYGEDHHHVFQSTLMMSTDIFINVLTILVVIYTISGKMVSPISIEKYFWVMFGVLLEAANYSYFKRNSRYKKVLKKFERESEEKARRGNTVMVIYSVGSFVLLIFAALISMKINS